MKYIKSILFISILCGFGFINAGITQEILTVSDNYGNQGDTLFIPVSISEISSDDEVISYQYMVSYDPQVLRALDATSNQTFLPNDWNVVSNPDYGDNIMSVGAYGTSILKGQGVVTQLKFEIIGEPGDTSIVKLSQIFLNDGSPSATSQDGMATVNYVEIFITTKPENLEFLFEGDAYSAPTTFKVTPRSSYLVNVQDPQNINEYERAVWLKWSDGGAKEHSLTAPETGIDTLVADFSKQFHLGLSVQPEESGNIIKNPDQEWYNPGTIVELTANPEVSYSFNTWSGDLISIQNPLTVPVDSAFHVIAKFYKVSGITVMSPNGGEDLKADNIYPIQWNWAGDIQFVRIEVSYDDHSNWETINDSTVNDGSYDWSVPNRPSESCCIRISDATNNELFDVSDAVFSIYPLDMEITINCDDEYELWVNGDYIGSDDRWDVAQRYTAPLRSGKNVLAIYGVNTGGPGALIAEVKVDGEVKLLTDGNWCRSSDAKTGWTDIGFDDSGWLNVVSHGQYGVDPWKRNITGFPDDSQTEWIWSEDTEDDQRSWYFRGSFENGPSVPPPEISSFSPDSGMVGTEVTVLGSNFTDVSAVRFYDVDAISYVVDSETQLRAVVPEGCTTGQIRVTASGGTALSGDDFVIIVEPSLAITAPNGGENWIQGSVKTIEWYSEGKIPNVKLDYSLDGGITWQEIVRNTVNDGSFNWTVPSKLTNLSKIRVANVTGEGPLDESDHVFSITKQTGEMDIVINCDDEYELWVNGDYIGSDDRWDIAKLYTVPIRSGKNVLAIHGVNTGGPGALIGEVRVDGEVKLVTNANWCRQSSEEFGWMGVGFDDSGWLHTISHGQYGVVPWKKNISGFPDDSQAEWIWSEDTKDDQRSWYFRGSFENGPSAPSPEITSFSPDSGVVGTEVTITGINFIDVSGVSFNGIFSTKFFVDSENKIRTKVPFGTSTGKVEVIAAGGTAVSDSYFQLLVVPSLLVEVPDGGESWSQGSVQTIKWQSEGNIPNVKLEYSVDGGTT